MKRRNAVILSLIVTIAGNLITGCALLPKQEEKRNVLVVKTEVSADYEMGLAQVGDIIDSKIIYCQYKQKNGQDYTFGLDNRKVKAVYVTTGDIVTTGDLLAELELGNIDEQIIEISDNIKRLNLMKTHLQRNTALTKELYYIYFDNGKLKQEELTQKLTSLEENYEEQSMKYNDSLYIEQLKLEELKYQRENGRIYAKMDGIVTYVNPGMLPNKSNPQETGITVMDNTEYAFSTKTEYAKYFAEGESVTVQTAAGDCYEATVAHDTANKEQVYFNLTMPDFKLKVGTRGNVTLILDKRENCLVIPTEALRKGNGFYYVYYENEDGVKGMKEITIGLQGNGKTEVTGGLKAGDLVIINSGG